MIRRLIATEQSSDQGKLGKWKATVFYVSRKKCWLLTNGFTKYNVILPDVKSSDLGDIESIFKNAFFNQLVYDKIFIDYGYLDDLIGGLDFLPSDGDRSLTGFQNQRLYELDWWKNEFVTLEHMPILDLASRMNSSPIHIGKSYQMSDYTRSIQEMKKLLMK